MRVTGVVFGIDFSVDSSAGDIVVNLYDSSDNVLASTTPNGEFYGKTTLQRAAILFPSTATLTAGATYRVTVAPTSTDRVSLLRFLFNSNGLLAQAFGVTNVYETQRQNGGSWLDVTTSTIDIALIVDQIDDGVQTGSTSTRSWWWFN